MKRYISIPITCMALAIALLLGKAPSAAGSPMPAPDYNFNWSELPAPILPMTVNGVNVGTTRYDNALSLLRQRGYKVDLSRQKNYNVITVPTRGMNVTTAGHPAVSIRYGFDPQADNRCVFAMVVHTFPTAAQADAFIKKVETEWDRNFRSLKTYYNGLPEYRQQMYWISFDKQATKSGFIVAVRYFILENA